MSVTLTGKVFHDLQHTGKLDSTYPGISNVYIALKYPDGHYTFTKTNSLGLYFFNDIDRTGDYLLYQLGYLDSMPSELPDLLDFPPGLNGLTSLRQLVIQITPKILQQEEALSSYDFGIDFTEPFEPTHFSYIFDNENSSILKLNLITGICETFLTLQSKDQYSCLCYNPLDQYFYGYNRSTHQLFRLSSNATPIHYTIKNLPNKPFSMAAIDHTGMLYLYAKHDNTFYKINLNPFLIGYLQLENISHTISPIDGQDWCFNPTTGYLYSIDTSGEVLLIDPVQNIVKPLATTGTSYFKQYGLVFDYQGYLYCITSSKQAIYRITLTPTTAVAEYFVNTNLPALSGATRNFHAPLYITFGTAPDHSLEYTANDYATRLINNGPRHGKINALYFGAISCNPVVYLTDTSYTINLPVHNQTGLPAFIYGWIDFNRNGLFEANEATSPIMISSSTEDFQTVSVSFTIPHPSMLSLGDTYIRLRLTTDTLQSSSNSTYAMDIRSVGPASDGDIIDASLTVAALPPEAPDPVYLQCEMNANINGFCKVTDSCNGQLHYTINRMPQNGIASVTASTGAWTYSPNHHYVGNDSFFLKATSSVSGLSCNIPIHLTIQQAEFTLTGTCSCEEATLNDILTYTLKVENTGTLTLDDLVISSTLSDNCQFVPHSIMINDIKDLGTSLEDGISLNQVEPHQIYQISYQIIVVDTTTLDLEIKSFAVCSYALSSHLPLSSLSHKSNSCHIFLKNPALSVSFEPNAGEALLGDTIQYTCKLLNTGDIPLYDLKLNSALATELQYLNELSLNHNAISEDICQGYILKYLEPDETALIQFTCKITESPSTGLIESVLFTSYSYRLNNVPKTSNNTATTASLQLCTPTVVLTKSADKHSVSIGEIFTFTFLATNTGSIPVEDVIIKDLLPLHFQVLQVHLNQNAILNTLSTGISLGPLPPQGTHALSVKVKVLTLCLEPNSLNTTAIGIFKVRLGKNFVLKTIYLEAKDSSDLIISEAHLTVTQTPNTHDACLNEIITYTITLKNTGTIVLSKVTIDDLLTPHLKFIPKSVKINNKSALSASIISGIHLTNFIPGEIQKICFDAQIISDSEKKINTNCTVHYTYRPHNGKDTKFGYATSLPCTVSLFNPHLTLSGYTSKTTGFLHDQLDYTFYIINDGDLDLFNVTLNLDCNASEIIDGTFKKNGTIIYSVNSHDCISLNSIATGEEICINYSCIVTGSSHYLETLSNILTVHFAYHNMNKCMKSGDPVVFSIDIPLALSTFKQLGLENTLEIPCQKPDIESISSVGGQISLLDHYILDTPKGTSIGGQYLTGSKLIIHAILELTIEFTADEPQHTIHTSNYTVPFSTFIVLSEHTPKQAPVHIESRIENISFKQINNRTFFTYSSLLMIAHMK